MKRIISFVLTLATILSVLTVTASAEYEQFFNDRNFGHAEKIASAMRDFKKSYSFGKNGISYDDFLWITKMVDYNNPDLYALTNGKGYTYYYEDNTFGQKIVTEIEFKYDIDKKTYENIVNKIIEPWAEVVTSLASPTFSDLEYAVFFHDYLCTNYTYDYSSSGEIHSLHEFITTGKGVCQSFMYAYMTLMRHVGIETVWACSDSMVHGWNQVKIDGQWYNVDATWDDTMSTVPGIFYHDFFLKSDAAFRGKADAPHYGWGSGKICSSTKYDGVNFGKARSSYAYLNNKWYYMNDGDLYVTDSPEYAGTRIRDYNNFWFVWGSGDTYYVDKFSCVFAYEGRLYINTPNTIIRVDPVGGSDTVVYSQNSGNGYIYGMTFDLGSDGISGAAFRGGRVYLAVTRNPDVAGDMISFKLPAYYGENNGNVNGDTKLNLADVSLLMKYIARWDVSVDLTRADFDENGKVNVTDVSKMMKRIAGWF